jgi:hypothetical protein
VEVGAIQRWRTRVSFGFRQPERSQPPVSYQSERDRMPTIGRIGSLDVMMFRNDHEPPHFHVIGAEFSAKFAIGDLALLSSKGRIRSRNIRAVEAWGHKHQSELYLNWNLARAGEPAAKIEDR